MNSTTKLVIVSLTWIILSHVFFSDSNLLAFAQNLPTGSSTETQITISAGIGEPVLRLWGYGPPNSRIEISGERVADFTYSRTDGYFDLSNVFLPQISDASYPELCLSAIDSISRVTPPTCIPPLPTNEFSYDIGPVILPPTLSLTKETTSTFSQAGASGTTIPNSEVKIVLAEDSSNSKLSNFTLVVPAKAYYIPDYTTHSNDRGNFSFNLPDNSPKTWHIFAITSYSQGTLSPKSNTLKFEVVSPITIGLVNTWALLLSLLTMQNLIIVEIAIILLIIMAIFSPKKNTKKIHLNVVDPVKQYREYLKSKRLL
jgi:hypothetical protein